MPTVQVAGPVVMHNLSRLLL